MNVVISVKRCIEQQLMKLEAEEKNLNSYYHDRMRVVNDGYYVGLSINK